MQAYFYIIHPIHLKWYADDAVVYCSSEAQARELNAEITKRMELCGLEIHSFEFLDFCFRPTLSRNKHGRYFVSFSPAVAPKSKMAIFAEIRGWCSSRRSELSVKKLANKLNPVVRGWIEYYGTDF